MNDAEGELTTLTSTVESQNVAIQELKDEKSKSGEHLEELTAKNAELELSAKNFSFEKEDDQILIREVSDFYHLYWNVSVVELTKYPPLQ